MHPRSQPLPRLLFGNALAPLQTSFHALADQFSHVLRHGDFDSSAQQRFLYKGNVFALGGLVINHAINSHLLARAGFEQPGLSLILGGHSSVSARHDRVNIARYSALLSPPGGMELLYETSPQQLTSSLHITFDLQRLNRVSLAMQGGEGRPVAEAHLQTVQLKYGPIDLRHLFVQAVQQIDAFSADPALLAAAGFDDQVYRLLVIALQPELFLKEYLTTSERRVLNNRHVLDAFEQHVEVHLQNPLPLTDIEVALGVSARALQYACMKRHGCPPSAYIRNRRLDYAYQLLEEGGGDIRLADLAAQLHFSSQSQFARYFRQRFGLRPSELQKARVIVGGVQLAASDQVAASMPQAAPTR